MHARIFLIALAIGTVPLTGTAALAQTGREERLTQAIAEAALLLRRQVRPGQEIAEIRKRMLAGFEAADLDAGGIGPSDAELGEAKAAAEHRARRVSELLRHDLDGDGAVTLAEAQAFQDYAGAAHRRVARRIQAEKQAATLRARVAACPIPEVPANAELIYLGIFKGEVISPILIGDANRVTYLGDFRIEKGNRPIYLMLGASTRIILRFGGDVDRLTHVVSLGTDLVGFAGLERRQAFWLTGPDCALEGWNPGATRGHSVFERAYVEALAGRRLDKVGGPGNVGLLELPSGDIIERLREPGQTLRREGPSGPSFKSLPSAGPQDLPRMTPDAVLVPPGITKMVMLK